MQKSYPFIISFFCLYGCMLGPKGNIAEPELPSQYREEIAIQSSAGDINKLWWKNFNDELLL